MSVRRLYIDEDSFAGALTRGLRARGFDVLTAAEASMLGRDDEDHLMLATAELRTLYSANVYDFAVIHRVWMEAGRTHEGIVVRSWQKMDIGSQLAAFVAMAESSDARQMGNRFEFLDQWLRRARA